MVQIDWPTANTVDASRTVAVLAPKGRDGTLARDLLAADGIHAVLTYSITQLAEALRNELGAVLMTEEALNGADFGVLEAALANQPPWSDLPFIILANGSASTRPAHAAMRIDRLSNAVLLSRPLHTEELLRSIRSALTARKRQHEARVRMDELQLRERQLRESEAKFHAIANSVDQMIWSTMPDGFHDYYNDRWYEFTGVPPGSTDGEAWNGMFHPDDQEKAWKIWRNSLATGEPYEIEYRLRHRSGQYRWVLGRAKAVRDANGAILRWYGSCTDIHDEVLAREATVDDLTRQRDQAWNLSLDLMAVSTYDGLIVTVNDAWPRFLGWSASDLIDASFTQFTHPDDLEAALDVLKTIPTTPLVEPYEFRLCHKDGSYRWIAWTASGYDGRIYAVGRDVTERRAKDEALAAAEAALRQSQKLEMIGQLTGGVAHDFNNLLMAIRASLDVLRRRLPPDAPSSLSYLDNAIRATERGAGLTQRMLAFARKQDLRADAVQVATVLPDLRDLLQRSIGAEIEIIIDAPDDLSAALVDTNQLEMAILNLAVNGRDAMNGCGTLRITARQVDSRASDDLEPGDYIRISVADSGVGMSARTLAQAMEPFFTTKGVGKGTGLGLSMVHGLAKQSGGTFQLESTPGMGTVATLYLPIADDTAQGIGPNAMNARPEEATAVSAQLTILVVDDDVLVAMGTVGLLEDMGHEVIEVHSGHAALEALEQRSDVDILLTDHAMPRMTGVELARRVRELRPDLPIVLTTGYADMPEGGAELIDARLEKPFLEAQLINVLNSVRPGRS